MAILTEKKKNKTKQSLGPIIFISALFISLIGLTMLAFFFFLMYHLFTLFLSLFPSLDFKAEALLSWASSGTNGKEFAYQCRRHKKRGLDSSVFGFRRSPGGGHGNPLQYSYLENPMHRGAWQAVVPRVTKSWTQLKQFSTQRIHVIMAHLCFPNV